MTKGFLCIFAALGTSLCLASAWADEPSSEDAAQLVDRAIVSATQHANKPRVETVSGWSVAQRSNPDQPQIVARAGGWTIVADDRQGDRLIRPRVIGDDITIWAASATLTKEGALIQEAFATSRNQHVRASQARLSLTPHAVTLDDAGNAASQAE